MKVHNEGYSTENWFGILEKVLTVEDLCMLDYDATFIAEFNDEAVGLIDVKIRNDLGDIENLVVLPKYRKRGIGKALLEKAVEFLNSKEVTKIRAEVPIQNEGAVRFYQKMGFQQVTYAYLIEVQNESQVERYLDRLLYFVEKCKFWVPCNDYMELIKKMNVNFVLVGKFNVMVKN